MPSMLPLAKLPDRIRSSPETDNFTCCAPRQGDPHGERLMAQVVTLAAPSVVTAQGSLADEIETARHRWSGKSPIAVPLASTTEGSLTAGQASPDTVRRWGNRLLTLAARI